MKTKVTLYCCLSIIWSPFEITYMLFKKEPSLVGQHLFDTIDKTLNLK